MGLTIVMTLISVLFLLFVVKLIRNATFTIDYALIWLIIGVTLLLFSIFPGIPAYLATKLGFELTSNFLLFAAVILGMVQSMLMTKNMTKQQQYIKTLIQELSILKKEINEKEQEK